MHPLHEYVVKQLTDKLKSRRVIVWYDVRREFAPFIAEVRGGTRINDEAVPVSIAGLSTRLAEYDGSMSARSTLVRSLERPPLSIFEFAAQSFEGSFLGYHRPVGVCEKD